MGVRMSEWYKEAKQVGTQRFLSHCFLHPRFKLYNSEKRRRQTGISGLSVELSNM